MSSRTDNKRFINNLITLHSNTIQLLCQNYIEHENRDSKVFIYPELINDVDVFNKRIECIQKIHEKFMSKTPYKMEPKTVNAFLKIIESEDCDYLSSEEHAMKLKNLMRLIDNGTPYPNSTTVELILVPSDKKNVSDDDGIFAQIKQFKELQNEFGALSEDEQSTVISTLIHDTGSYKEHMNSVLLNLLLDVKSGSIITAADKQRIDIARHNLLKINIRVLSVKELLTVPLSNEYYFLLSSEKVIFILCKMFLSRTGSTRRGLTFGVIYSVLQKSLRGNFQELALEMVKEFREYPNALKKRLIQNVCEDVADMELVNRIYETPASLEELVGFVPFICTHVKCREGVWAFRVALEYPDDMQPITSEDTLLTMSIKEKSRIRANDTEYLLGYFKKNVCENIKKIYTFTSKNRSVLDGCVAYLTQPYTHAAIPETFPIPEGFDINEVKDIPIPDFMFDKHTGQFAKDKRYSYFLNNMVIEPRLPESPIEKLARRLYIERNKRTRELITLNPTTIPSFPELTASAPAQTSAPTDIVRETTLDLSRMKLIQTQLITSRYKPKTYFCSFDDGETYPLILKKGMQDVEYEKLKLADDLKPIFGIRQTHIRKLDGTPYIIMDNFIKDSIDATLTTHKISKLEDAVVYSGDIHAIDNDTIIDSRYALSILKSLAFRKIIGTCDTCNRNIIKVSNTEVASIDDPACFKEYQETMFKKTLSPDLAERYKSALHTYQNEIQEWLDDIYDKLDSKYTFSMSMCEKLYEIDNWKF